MDSWWVVLLAKPFIAIGVFAVLFGIPIVLTWLLRPLFPAGRLKDFLFRERGTHRASAAPDAGQGGFNNVPIIRGELCEDRPSLRRVGEDFD